MSPRPRRSAGANTPDPHPDFTSVSPERRRAGADLLTQLQALDHVPETPEVLAKRASLREQARAMGLQLKSFSISVEPLPDPEMDALPQATQRELRAVHKAMYTRPAQQLTKLRALVAAHPRIPSLRNQLFQALMCSDREAEAERVLAECFREFPAYFFAFCNLVIHLVRNGRIAEARAIIETSPRGPLFSLCDFDPSREVFHISEAVSFGCTVGHYLAATGRHEAAKVQLSMLLTLDPESPQAIALAGFMRPTDVDEVLSELKQRAMASERQRRASRPKRAQQSRPSPPASPAPSPSAKSPRRA